MQSDHSLHCSMKILFSQSMILIFDIATLWDLTIGSKNSLFPNRENLGSSKLKEFADDNFSFDENWGQISKWVENTAGKGEIARHEQFLLFLQCFQKTCAADT